MCVFVCVCVFTKWSNVGLLLVSPSKIVTASVSTTQLSATLPRALPLETEAASEKWWGGGVGGETRVGANLNESARASERASVRARARACESARARAIQAS